MLEVPANKKLYFIYNNSTGGYAVTVKVSGQTGVSVANGTKVILVSNGTDIVTATSYTLIPATGLPVTSGGTGVTTLTAAEAIARVARFAYVGLLIGPVLIGGVAHLANLRIGLAVVALTMGYIALFGARAARRYLQT
mgnify:CR=1 FL=1